RRLRPGGAAAGERLEERQRQRRAAGAAQKPAARMRRTHTTRRTGHAGLVVPVPVPLPVPVHGEPTFLRRKLGYWASRLKASPRPTPGWPSAFDTSWATQASALPVVGSR